jgi:hypothetical protein
MQHLCHVNVIHPYMISHVVIPNIATLHKRVEIELEDGSKLPHKFTDLCQEFMWLSFPSTDPQTPPKSLCLMW